MELDPKSEDGPGTNPRFLMSLKQAGFKGQSALHISGGFVLQKISPALNLDMYPTPTIENQCSE